MPARAARRGRAREPAWAAPGALQAPGDATASPRERWGGTGAGAGARSTGVPAIAGSRGPGSHRCPRGGPVPPPAAPHAQLRLRPGKGRAPRPRSGHRRSGPYGGGASLALLALPGRGAPRLILSSRGPGAPPPPCLIQHPMRCPHSGPLPGHHSAESAWHLQERPPQSSRRFPRVVSGAWRRRCQPAPLASGYPRERRAWGLVGKGEEGLGVQGLACRCVTLAVTQSVLKGLRKVRGWKNGEEKRCLGRRGGSVQRYSSIWNFGAC